MTTSNPTTAPDAGHAAETIFDIIKREIMKEISLFADDDDRVARRRFTSMAGRAAARASLRIADLESQHTDSTPARSHAAGTPGEGDQS